MNQKTPGGGGVLVKILIGMLVFFLGLKFTKTSFFWVSLSCRHFLGLKKFPSFFGFIENLRHFLGY